MIITIREPEDVAGTATLCGITQCVMYITYIISFNLHKNPKRYVLSFAPILQIRKSR